MPPVLAAVPTQVWLSDLATTSGGLTTAMVHDREAPANGVRESADGVEVTTSCGDTCADGLVDVASGRTFDVPPVAPPAPDTWVETFVTLDHVDAGTVSAWVGGSWFTDGAAHAQNALSCGVWSRATGERLRLVDLVGRRAARRALAELTSQQRALVRDGLAAAGTLDGLRAVRPDTAAVLQRRQSVFVCVEPDFAESGSTLVWPLRR